MFPWYQQLPSFAPGEKSANPTENVGIFGLVLVDRSKFELRDWRLPMPIRDNHHSRNIIHSPDQTVVVQILARTNPSSTSLQNSWICDWSRQLNDASVQRSRCRPKSKQIHEDESRNFDGDRIIIHRRTERVETRELHWKRIDIVWC